MGSTAWYIGCAVVLIALIAVYFVVRKKQQGG